MFPTILQPASKPPRPKPSASKPSQRVAFRKPGPNISSASITPPPPAQVVSALRPSASRLSVGASSTCSSTNPFLNAPPTQLYDNGVPPLRPIPGLFTEKGLCLNKCTLPTFYTYLCLSPNFPLAVVITEGGNHHVYYRPEHQMAPSNIFFNWTISDFRGPMDLIIDDAATEDVHVHRDQSRDKVLIYIWQHDGVWINFRDTWCVLVNNPPVHPLQKDYILDSYGMSGQPFYISYATYRNCNKCRVGLEKGYPCLPLSM